MNQELLGLAFGAGLVAALNPCGFAMLPAYLALVVRGEDSEPIPEDAGLSTSLCALSRALAATAAMAAGFVAVFGIFGVLTVSLASTVQSYLPFVTVVIGILLVALGIWLLAGRELAMPGWFGRSARWAPTARLGSMFGYGVSYAIASLSCTIGPFLAVTGASLRGGTIIDGVAVYVAYAAGITLVVGTLAVAAAFANSAVLEWMRYVLPFVNRVNGALLIVVGLYVGYYGVYEVRLFHANGNPVDPLVSAAGRLQGSLAGWVYQHGAWPWVVLIVVLLVAGGASTWVGRRAVRNRGNRSRQQPEGEPPGRAELADRAGRSTMGR
ncbi:MAG TPA: cytochrome c biogenesis CcdA family protein [Mycobacterium sp.]|nr:cytochrome c biogenesis CcdA family protein [Mycobacterium sp.]